MKFRRFVNRAAIIAVCLGISFTQAGAQTRTLTLDDAVKTALENNPETKIAQMTVDQARASVDEAFGYALPSVNLSANLTHFLEKPKTPFPDFGAMLTNSTYGVLFKEKVLPEDESKYLPMETKLQSFAQSNSYEAKAEITQILFNSAVFKGIGASEVYLRTSQAALKSNIAKTVLNVKKAFNAVLLTKSLLDITRSSLVNGQANLKNVQALYAQGLVSEYDAMQAEVQVGNLLPVVKQMENNYNTAVDGLLMSMGLSPQQSIEISGELVYNEEIINNSDNLAELARNSNFDIQTLTQKREVDQAMIELSTSEYWPTIAAFGNYSYAGSSDNFSFNSYSSAMVGISFSINLFNGNMTQKKVEKAEIDVLKTEQQLSQTKDYVTMQIKTQTAEINRIKTNIDAQDRNVKLAQRAYDLSTVRYKEGTGSQIEIQNADLSLRQARTNLLQSAYEYQNAKAEIDNLTGNVEQKYLNMFLTNFAK